MRARLYGLAAIGLSLSTTILSVQVLMASWSSLDACLEDSYGYSKLFHVHDAR
jgi:hypothetical protein